MRMVIYKKWNTIKPPVGAQINWGHPLSKGLVGCWLMNEGGGERLTNLADGKNQGASFTSGYWDVGYGGVCLSNLATTVPVVTYPFQQNFLTNTFTVLCLVTHTVATGAIRYFALDGSTGNRAWAIGRNSTTNQYRLAMWKTGDTQVNCIGTIKYTEGRLVNLVGTYDKKFVNLYVDGVSIATPVVETSDLQVTNAPIGFLGPAVGATGTTLIGKLFLAMLYNRALSPREIQSLYQAPYQFIRPVTRRFFSSGDTSAPTATYIRRINHLTMMGVG